MVVAVESRVIPEFYQSCSNIDVQYCFNERNFKITVIIGSFCHIFVSDVNFLDDGAPTPLAVGNGSSSRGSLRVRVTDRVEVG